MKFGKKGENLNNDSGNSATGWEGVAEQSGTFDKDAAEKAARQKKLEIIDNGYTKDENERLGIIENLLKNEDDPKEQERLQALKKELWDDWEARGEEKIEKRKEIAETKAKMEELANMKKNFSDMYDENGKKRVERPSAWLGVEFADGISKEEMQAEILREKAEIQALLEEFKNAKPGSRKSRKLQGQLERFGYGADGQLNTRECTALIRGDAEDAVYRRAVRYKQIEIALSGVDRKKNLKTLKKNVFSKIPYTWNDKNFTTNEILRMAWLCEETNQEMPDSIANGSGKDYKDKEPKES